MNENIKTFLEAAQADPDLRQRLCKMSKEELMSAAKGLGVELSDADFAPPAGEMGAEELENVAGGWGFCLLFGGGGGTDDNDGNTYGCACWTYGQGGDGRLSDSNCLCYFVGTGASDEQLYSRW